MTGYNANDMATRGAAQEAVASLNDNGSVKRATKQAAPKELWGRKLTRSERQCWAQGFNAAPVAAVPVDGLHLAVIGRNHFGNPIPQEWYAAARELLASTSAAPAVAYDTQLGYTLADIHDAFSRGKAAASPKGGSTDAEPKIWGTQKPGSMPKLFGARHIAELNWYPDEGYDLICMQVIERVQPTSHGAGVSDD